MYLITTAQFDPSTQTAYYTSTSGLFMNQPVTHAVAAKSSLRGGYLRAVLDGFKKIQGFYGTGGRVDVLIENKAIAEEIRNASAHKISRLLHFDDEELWAKLVERLEQYEVVVVTHPGQSEELTRLWINQNPEAHPVSPSLFIHECQIREQQEVQQARQRQELQEQEALLRQQQRDLRILAGRQ